MHETLPEDTIETRPSGPRTFRPLRQRARPRLEKDISSFIARHSGGGEMEKDLRERDAREPPVPTDNLIDRTSLCLPHYGNDAVLHQGDAGFTDALRQYFPSAESNALERLVDLKSKLRCASTHDFWSILMEEMCDITGSQCGFVAKRMLVDDQDSAVEMPELGDPGSCLMGVAFYINNGESPKQFHRDYRYHAFGTPCGYMRHDKVFIIPERLAEFTPNSPNVIPGEKSEAFIGLPLFTEGKCFAHFGMVWSSEGGTSRKLSWSFIEMFMHSLEDMILQRILEGRGFVKETAPPDSVSSRIIPLAAITAAQSLKPYARGLSHELRTPMQGVVGMLDIMYSTVLDAIDNQQSDRVRSVFEDLKEHIEMVQESSRRAVEAADNVVHAYDLNMQMPEMPLTANDLNSFQGTKSDPTLGHQHWPSVANSIPVAKKRKLSAELNFDAGPRSKRVFKLAEARVLNSYCAPPATPVYEESLTSANSITETLSTAASTVDLNIDRQWLYKKSISPAILSPLHRFIKTLDFMRNLIREVLRNGPPRKVTLQETESGEYLHVTSTGSDGMPQDRKIYLSIGPDVPETIITEQQHLKFALQKLIDNAIKFTEQGIIGINVNTAQNMQVVEIRVIDTGCGISEEWKSSLFKPHFQEDSSIRRSRDGLGLSLFNAKAHIRKNLGGDITLERSCTHGLQQGSEFVIRLPISALETGRTDYPLMGTPPLSGLNSPRLSPLPEPLLDSLAISIESPCRPKPLRSKSSHKRITFNPQLATDYPLNILIAEDNAINREVAMGSLKKLGYRKENITLAFDGAEAVRRYKASIDGPLAQRFSVILMDIWMPILDGYKATTQILDLAQQRGEATKIIAVTADITEDCVGRAKGAGMQGFLAKPYKVFDIERLIVEHFETCC
ncbi:related to histidine kinase tcsA protein [Rhynchosporium secalis]|uniref:histidine kinase n=1 Tax=Rhynchosporium secalis TaxID=38038 RepID=A0A1E1M152_RHYSE|nr:related to histidine kinase tcsA protein [Rhynchosporium secalis]